MQNDDDADLIIYNTCTVKGKTQDKIFSDIKNVLQTAPEKKIIISGCMASAQTQLLRDLAPGASIISLQNLTALPTVLTTIFQGDIITLIQRNKEAKVGLPKVSRDDNVAIIQIAEGCADACTFCITKLAKGYIFSFPKQQIIHEAQRAIQKGASLLHLTSQDNGAYGLDHAPQSQLVPLLEALTNLEGNFTIRLGMTNPRHIIPITNDLIRVFTHPKMLKFLHIPVQSGSENVLNAMQRKHTIIEFKDLVHRFRTAIPDIQIATDIICGYPTETEEDFQATLNLLQELQPEVLNISKFTPRPGTRAATLKPHTSQEIKQRTTLTHVLYQQYMQNNPTKAPIL